MIKIGNNVWNDKEELKKFLKAAINHEEIKYKGYRCIIDEFSLLTANDLNNIESFTINHKKIREGILSGTLGFFSWEKYNIHILFEEKEMYYTLKGEKTIQKIEFMIKRSCLENFNNFKSLKFADKEWLQKNYDSKETGFWPLQ